MVKIEIIQAKKNNIKHQINKSVCSAFPAFIFFCVLYVFRFLLFFTYYIPLVDNDADVVVFGIFKPIHKKI